MTKIEEAMRKGIIEWYDHQTDEMKKTLCEHIEDIGDWTVYSKCGMPKSEPG